MISSRVYHFSPDTADVTIYAGPVFATVDRAFVKFNLDEIAEWAQLTGLGYMKSDGSSWGCRKLYLFGKRAKELYLLRWA